MRPSAIRLLYFGIIDTRPARRLVSLIDRVAGGSRVGLTHRSVVLPDLPKRAHGLNVLHVSDLHLHRGGPDIREIWAAARSAEPVDLLVYTGDFINDDSGIEMVGDLLGQMPTARFGTIAVLGNHDHYSLTFHARRNNVAGLVAVLEAAGVVVLRNASRHLEALGLYVVGLDDPVTGMSDLGSAFADVPPAAPAVLLAHTPDVVFTLDGRRPLAVLAGHTHGGQVRLPGLGAVVRVSRLPRRRQSGVQSVRGCAVHISPGVGLSGPALRLGVPPEVTRLTLLRG